MVFLDDEGFNWCDDLNKTVNILRKRTIPVIVANTDKAYPVSIKRCRDCNWRYSRNDRKYNRQAIHQVR